MAQTIKGTGLSSDREMQVDPLHRAARFSQRPTDKGAGGSYQLALVSGTMAAGLAAASLVWEMRWFSSAMVALVRRIRLAAGNSATAFTAGFTTFDLVKATGFTVLDATGGTAPTIKGKDQTKSSRFAPSLMQSTSGSGLFIISATGALSAGTKTLDTNALASFASSVTATAGGVIVPNGTELFAAGGDKEPLELFVSEGLVIRATVPATGTWQFSVEVDWDEVDPSPARYFA